MSLSGKSRIEKVGSTSVNSSSLPLASAAAAANENLSDEQLINIEKEAQDDTDSNDNDKSENVKVMVRCRPLSSKEIKLLSGTKKANSVNVHEQDKCVEIDGREFPFDAVFGPNSDNELVYMKSMRQLVESAFKGYNCTVFLYGQTGTGKTYTHSSLTSSSFAHLFSLISNSNSKARFLIRASYYELYNEDIHDLLATNNSNKALELRESKSRGVYVKDLSSYLVNNINELEKLKKFGDKQRATAATKMNEHSSRSHSIFSITIETVDNENNVDQSVNRKVPSSRKKTPSSASASSSSSSTISKTTNPSPVRVGRLHLIDLAGSERQAKSGSTGARLKEASKINLSLTCLSLVIRALTDKTSSHVPYRNSKLTRLLSGSLGGNSKTLLIACISPAISNLDETLNTLRFASRTKRIKNKARINEDAKDALLRKYRKQIEELKSKLREQQQQRTFSEEEAIESLIENDDQQIGGKELSNKGDDLTNSKHQINSNDQNLLQQLRLLKGKIMIGGENLLEKAEMHERLLEASRREIEEKRREEQKLKEKLMKKHENIEKMTKTKGSLENQVIELDERLKRVLLLYKRTKEEQRDLESEHNQLKESLLQTIRATSKEIKYSDCIIENFIPREYLDLINTYAQYDDDSDEWQIKYIALSGNNIAQTKRLTATNGQEQLQRNLLLSSSASSSGTESNRGDKKAKIKLKQLNNRSDPYIRLKNLI